MHSRYALGTALLAITLTLGCRGTQPQGTTNLITTEGCLTAGSGGMVLTRLTRAEGSGPATVEPPTTGAPPPEQATETYVLKGMEDQLRPQVGRQVRVSGEAPPQSVEVVREQAPAAATGATGTSTPAATGTGGPQPRVSTTERTRFETGELQVRSVTALNQPCAAPR